MKLLPGKNGKWHFRGPKKKKLFWGSMTPHPPRGSRLRRSFLYPLLYVPKRKNHATPLLLYKSLKSGGINGLLPCRCTHGVKECFFTPVRTFSPRSPVDCTRAHQYHQGGAGGLFTESRRVQLRNTSAGNGHSFRAF